MRNVDIHAGTEFVIQKIKNGGTCRISSNTNVRDGEMYLFGNKIAKWDNEHTLLFNMCGYGTLTTRARFDGILDKARQVLPELFPQNMWKMFVSQYKHEQWIEYLEEIGDIRIKLAQRISDYGYFSPLQFAHKASCIVYDVGKNHTEDFKCLRLKGVFPTI